MRLIDVQTYQLKEFSGQNVPPYAILSHTWGEHEVSYADWERHLQRGWPLDPSISNSHSPNAGLEKIQLACQQCRVHGLFYLWVDTNCINKNSSAELTEAINSMFVWYAEAAVCYAYLVDVEYESEEAYIHGLKPFESLKKSRWFTRGWTLQELLAPLDVRFYSRSWKFISGKTDTDLCPLLSKITKISQPYLAGRSFMAATVAEKMSWAAKRETTRAEDLAYCLLGIFNIHMPILYGERGNAFLRLQEEIIKKSTDQSLFFWEMIYEDVAQLRAHKWINFLAPSPRGFADYPFPLAAALPWMPKGRQIPQSYSISNSGLHIQLPILYNASWSTDIQVYAFAVLEPMEYRHFDSFDSEHNGFFCIPISPMDGEKVFQRSLNWRRPVYLKARNLKWSPRDNSDSEPSTFHWSNTHITIGPDVTVSWELRHPTTIHPSSNSITDLSHHGRLFVMYNNDQWTWDGFNMARFPSSSISPVMPIEVMSSHERLSAQLMVTFDLEFLDSAGCVVVKPSTKMELRRKTGINSSQSISKSRLGSSRPGTKVVAQLNKQLTLSQFDASNSVLILSWGVISVRLTVVGAKHVFVIAHFIHEEPKLDDGLFEIQGP